MVDASRRRETQTVDTTNIITGLKGSGDWVQVGRNALPLFNAGLVGTQRQTLYLHTSPMHDVTNFGADMLFPVLVRDAEALGIYAALGVPPATVATLKGPRADIINAINLGRPIPIADGFTGDVITLDAAIDSSFPNGRRLGGGTAPNRNQVNVNSVLISLIVAGNPAAGLAKGRRGQRQELPRSVPVPGARSSGSAPGSRRHQRADGAEHPDSVVRRDSLFVQVRPPSRRPSARQRNRTSTIRHRYEDTADDRINASPSRQPGSSSWPSPC